MFRREPVFRPEYLAPVLSFLRAYALVIMVGMALSTTTSPDAQAQNATPPAAPIDLGTVVQKSTPGAPPPRVYLKLPERVPLPRPKQAPQSGAAASAPANAPGSAQNQDTEATSNADPAPAQDQPLEPEKPQPVHIRPGESAILHLTALLSDEGEILQRGVNWRVFSEERDENGRLPLLENVDGGVVDFALRTGSYIVYAGYGYANLTKRIVLDRAGSYSENFNLQAGAIRLKAVAPGDIKLDNSILRFDIYTREGAGETAQRMVVQGAKPDHVIKLTEGTYHVVSSYGASNAKVRGDVEVEAGKLVNVTMIHNAAKVTLRLVSEPGGEALANTLWTVLTPGGDVVKRAIGAFPTLALSAGDYTAIAKQNEEIYNRDFSVDAGLDRDIEVLATVQ